MSELLHMVLEEAFVESKTIVDVNINSKVDLLK